MTEQDDRKSESDYLWDPKAPPDPHVVAVERPLQQLQFDPARRRLAGLTDARLARRRMVRWRVGLAMAASLTLIAGLGGWFLWRMAWPVGRPWPITRASAVATGAAPARLEIDQPFQAGDTAAHVKIARIGSMEVQPGTDLTLSATRSNHHRLLMTRGTIRVSVWAPPGAIALHTPSGEVIDLGCVFRLEVSAGRTDIHVETGWVQMENVYGETLVPAGSSSSMSIDRRPTVPVFDDATPRFRDGIRAIEGAESDDLRLAIAARALPDARPRDVLTLLVLSNTIGGGVRRSLLERAAQLVPPPPGVTVDAILGVDRLLMWEWYGTLDLPAPKNWWVNWRDAFR